MIDVIVSKGILLSTAMMKMGMTFKMKIGIFAMVILTV
jgi:hypothetical protein